MSLTQGTGPLAGHAAPTNFTVEAPAHRIVFEPDPRRLRAIVGGELVLDTDRLHLLHETGALAVAYAPLEDFDAALLERTSTSTHCPFKGDASYWSVNGVEDALWAYEQPIASAPWLAGFAALDRWKVDAFFVEEDRVFGKHLRDPYTRVDVHDSSRAVVVRVGDEVIAESPRPKLVFETGLPPRVYVPPADVRPGAVSRSAKRDECPYKGQSWYWHVHAGDRTLEDAAWSYENPLPEALRVQGHFCFDLGDGVTVSR